ncbi:MULTISPECIES: MerR family transcriptional regulator [unclassified Streptomyces]|uniref:MerR family transcriptional regulator n=1 Tax=unclassified Streptomyces TaxID=2593676 RepID=UPI00368333B0
MSGRSSPSRSSSDSATRTAMKIGELAERAGPSTRMLRYYESQRLLHSERGPNGYRRFQDGDVERVRTIASLIRSGLPTRLIHVLLTAQDRPDDWTDACDQEFTALLRAELNALDDKIVCLTRSRTAVNAYLERAAD